MIPIQKALNKKRVRYHDNKIKILKKGENNNG